MRLPLGTGRPEKGFFVADRSYSGRSGGVATRYHRDCVGHDEFVAWGEDSGGIDTHSDTNTNTNSDPDANSDPNSNSDGNPDSDPNSIARSFRNADQFGPDR